MRPTPFVETIAKALEDHPVVGALAPATHLLDPPISEFNRRIGFAKGMIAEALGSLAAMSPQHPEVYWAERALRRAIAELDGKTVQL